MLWTLIFIGMAVGRLGILGPTAQDALTRYVYWLAAPSVLYTTVAGSDPHEVLGVRVLVEAFSALGAVAISVLISRLLLKATPVETTVGAMAASVSNAAYIGLAMSTYVLGSPTHVIPVLIFQVGLLTPTFFVLTDLVASSTRPTWKSTAKLIVTNPILLGSGLGFVSSISGLHLPGPIKEAVGALGSSAVPAILVAFGIGLLKSGLSGFKPYAAKIASSTTIKLVIQPLLAFIAARFIFGLGDFEVFAATAMAALPAAQNVYIAAYRAGAGQELANGVVIASTIFVTPVMLAIAALLS